MPLVREFTKQGTVYAKPGSMGGNPGPYFPCLVDMSAVTDYPYDRTLFVSTDHGSGAEAAGGIWQANADTLADAVATGFIEYDGNDTPWSAISPSVTSNPIVQYTDTGDGDQTETPSVLVLGASSVIMLNHNDGGPFGADVQTTNSFSSTNGVDFTFQDHALSYDPSALQGDGHTGYARAAVNPFEAIPYDYIAYSAHGGGNHYHNAQWGSNDPTDPTAWELLAILDPVAGRVTDGTFPDAIVVWHSIDTASIRPLGGGLYTAYIAFSERASGAVERTQKIYQIVLDQYGRSILYRPLLVVDNTVGGADENEATFPNFMQEAGVDYLIYMGTSGGNVNAILAASRPTPTTPERIQDFLPLSPKVPDGLLRHSIDLRTTAALDQRLTAYSLGSGVTNSETANGYQSVITANGSDGGFRWSDTIRLSDYDFVEFFVNEMYFSGATEDAIPIVGFGAGSSDLVGTTPYFRIISLFSADGLLRFQIDTGSGVDNQDPGVYDWGYDDNEHLAPRSLGLRIWPRLATPKCYVLAGVNKHEICEVDISAWDMDQDVYPYTLGRNATASATLTRLVEGVELTLGTNLPSSSALTMGLTFPLTLED